MALRFILAGFVALLLLGTSLAASSIEVVGKTEATLAWTAADGPVAGYYVIVTRDAGPTQVEAISLDLLETVAGEYGETLVVQVSAFRADGVAGPVSPPSEPITFRPADSPGGGGGDGGGDGGTGGGGGDPGSGDPDPVPPDVSPATARDFDGDGLADLLVQQGDSLHVWALEAAQVVSEIPLPLVPEGARLVGTGDYDGNRSADLLWEDRKTRALELWQLDGGIVTQTQLLDRGTLPDEEIWLVGGSGDLDGDGGDDLLLFSRKTGETEVWTFDAAGVATRDRFPGRLGSWTPTVVAAEGGALVVWLEDVARVLEVEAPGGEARVLGELKKGWRPVGSANHDGTEGAALLLRRKDSGAIQAWSLGSEFSSVELAIDARGKLASTGDYDGDGRDDLALSHSKTGAITLRFSGADVEERLDRDLPDGAALIDGARGSDDRPWRWSWDRGHLLYWSDLGS